MREILFRGKNIKTGEWVYGYYYTLNEYHCIRNDNERPENMDCIVEPDTVGQYIGVDDLYGNKIFEGDILSNKRFNRAGDIRTGDNFIVEWNERDVRFEAKYLTDVYKQMRTCELLSDVKVKYIFNRIGNKWDNPELLEVHQ